MPLGMAAFAETLTYDRLPAELLAGPVYRILAKLENQSIPSPTITVPALAISAPPTWPIASVSAGSPRRPRASSSRYRAIRNRQ